MEWLAAILTGWIALQTGLAPVESPHIELVTPTSMSERAFGPGIASSLRLRAIYSQPEGTIYLRKSWDPSNLRDQSELLHELVHHFQNVHRLRYACGAEREELAYDLQVRWLREQGVADPHELLQINPFFVVMVSVCRDAEHD